jgi:hypothetical protein
MNKVFVLWFVLLLGSGCSVASKTLPSSQPNPRGTEQRGESTAANDAAPSQEAIQDWESYTNAKYGYQIKYPSGNGIDVSEPAKVKIKFTQPFEEEGSKGTDEFSFVIAVHENPRQLAPKAWFEMLQLGPEYVRQEQNINVGGLQALKVTLFEGDSNSVHIYISGSISGSKKLYEISYWSPDSMNYYSATLRSHYEQVFQYMVNTFHLLKNK